MGFPLLEYIKQLNIIEITVLTLVLLVLLYVFLSNQIHILMFLLTLSAALFTSTIPIASAISSITRWLTIGLLVIAGILFGKLKISLGVLLFWGYVFSGFIALFLANDLMWQIQKGGLLVLVAAAIPVAYGDKPYKVFRSSLMMIALVAVIYSLMNFSLLPGNMSDSVRFFGYGKAAPAFAMVLGALLPFSFWGLWKADALGIKIIFGIGFIVGLVTLLYSAQRAGIVAGLAGLFPLALMFIRQKKNAKWAFLLFVFLLSTGYYFYQQTSLEKILFLQNRYSLDAGLSNRELIWQFALGRIQTAPLFGRGIGAAETTFSSSFHNAYLEVWYNTGILGLSFFLTAQIYFLGRIFQISRKYSDPDVNSILALALGYFMGFMLLNLFESAGAGASNLNLILFLFLGVLVSNKDLLETQPEQINSSLTTKDKNTSIFLRQTF